MARVFDWPDRARVRAALLVLAVAVLPAACSERIDGGGVCPALCPSHPLATRQVTILADSSATPTPTIIGFPTRGTEPALIVATRGDTLDARMVVRFDTLPQTHFRSPSSTERDSTVNIDSVALVIRYDTSKVLGVPITLNLYDVDTVAADTNDAAVLALFRPDRLVGTQVITPEDSGRIEIPIDSAWLIGRIRGAQRVRFGIQAVHPGGGSAEVHIFGIEDPGGRYPRILVDPAPSTETSRITYSPLSTTPAENSLVAFDLNDYPVLAIPLDPAPVGAFAIGGWPGRRALLRFRLPPEIVDSATVIRATLTLHQLPARSPDRDDTLFVQAHPVNARATVPDPAKIALLATDLALSVAPVVPSADTTITLELGVLVRQWAGRDTIDTPRLIVLRAQNEAAARVAWFYGADAPMAVRPTLTLVYIPAADVGLH